jgi:hypothetical protein
MLGTLDADGNSSLQSPTRREMVKLWRRLVGPFCVVCGGINWESGARLEDLSRVGNNLIRSEQRRKLVRLAVRVEVIRSPSAR